MNDMAPRYIFVIIGVPKTKSHAITLVWSVILHYSYAVYKCSFVFLIVLNMLLELRSEMYQILNI